MTLPTRLIRRLQRLNRQLRISVVTKILIANVVILLVGAIVGMRLDRQLVETNRQWELVAFIVLGLGATVAVNYGLIRLALFALLPVERAALRAEDGDLSARVDTELIDDPDIERLARAINSMMSSLEENTAEIRHSRDRLRLLADRVLEAQESERKRIGRELHDETAQSLATLIIYLQTALEALPENATGRRPLEKGLDLAQATLEDVEAIIRDLRPSLLDDLGLVPAIRWQIVNRLEVAGLAVEFDVCGGDRRLPPAVETGLYRIAQEAFTNILKHAAASQVQIRLNVKARLVTLSVKDNGRGFDPQGALTVEPAIGPGPRLHGMGLFGMRERVELLGGVFQLVSSPGGGTQIEVTVPLSEWRVEQSAPMPPGESRIVDGNGRDGGNSRVVGR